MAEMNKNASRELPGENEIHDVVVVGAGFSGLYALYRLRAAGFGTRVLEAAGDVGGTWYSNRYPGARCDVESMSYSYSFSEELQQEWTWSERYAAQPEILRYINHVADRFDLRRDITFNTRVAGVHYDERENLWRISTEQGGSLKARFCIMATGCLSTPKPPETEGFEVFEGQCYHTGQWPHEPIDFAGKRVAVIGTGSSGVQSIPVIAQQASHLTVFQRTPAFSVPARNAPLSPETISDWKANYPALRARERRAHSGFHNEGGHPAAADLSEEERQGVLQSQWEKGGLLMWNVFSDLMRNTEANDCAAAFVHDKIRSVVRDPEVAEMLCPKEIPIGSKRLCVDTGYYETFNRDNVTLVDLRRTPMQAITRNGIACGGREHEFEIIVFATGFDAMTGTLLRMDVRGRGGERLQDKWRDGPRSYLGLALAGFPNLFLVTGPGSPAILANVMVGLEQHIDWITRCLCTLRERGLGVIEPSERAEDEWVTHVDELIADTLFMKGKSWYLGANVPGKPRVFMAYAGGAGKYRKVCDEIADNDYEGFDLSAQS